MLLNIFYHSWTEYFITSATNDNNEYWKHCRSKSAEIVDRLLAAGAQADGRNSKTKRTCLHMAVSDRGKLYITNR